MPATHISPAFCLRYDAAFRGPAYTMKLLYDFLPIVLFFVAYKVAGIFAATAVAVAAALVQVGWSWLRHRRVEPMHLVSAGLIAVLGGITLALHDKTFIMWKPSLVYLLFAGVFAASQLFGERPLIERLLSGQLRMPRPQWRKLGWAWLGFFLVCGVANAGMVHYYSRAETALRQARPEASATAINDLQCSRDFPGSAGRLCEEAAAREALWVDFKLFGLIALTLLFVVAQSLWLARHAEAIADTGDEEGPNCSTRS